ncbi:MAG: ATP-binding domain-containing protein [Gammaproteobacteria bacterium]|nr:ATP-binding domain-containing protein [Gammaproteobacteria bacterium]
MVRLTDQQAYMLTFIDQRPRAAIQGVAGSGKTMLAQAQAQRFADRGLSVLFTCFNKGLAHWLQDTLPADYSEQITVRHFHGLCDEWCQEAGIPFDPDNHDPATFWREIAPNRLMDALDIIQRRFDAIVVDEGQDFHPDWWVPLEALNTKAQAGPLYVFFDPAQNLFVDREWNLPDIDGEPYVLERNCRNTRRIAQTCGEIIEKLIETHELAPEGTETIFRTAQTNREQIQVCGEILKEWVGQGQLQYQQIAILSPLTKPKSSLDGVDNIAKFPIINDVGAWQKNKGILFSTIRSFKGLEADAVILIDAAEPDTKPYFKRPDYYVACSRAKHRLAVIRKAAD